MNPKYVRIFIKNITMNKAVYNTYKMLQRETILVNILFINLCELTLTQPSELFNSPSSPRGKSI